jgi:hypothetical protein
MDVPQGNMGNENSHNDDDDEPEGNGALEIHLDLHVMAYLYATEVLVGLTPKERNQVVHKAKWSQGKVIPYYVRGQMGECR